MGSQCLFESIRAPLELSNSLSGAYRNYNCNDGYDDYESE